MNDVLLLKMEKDLQLFRFYNEPQSKYIARVLYSGMAMWMKAIALDGFTEDGDKQSSVSRKHHTERSEFILKQFLNFAPEVETWFYDDNSLNNPLFPIHLIQERLLLSGELFELGFTNRITPVLPTKISITDSIVCCKGLHNGIQAQYNGITSVIEERLDVTITNLLIDTLDFAEKYLCSIDLTPDSWSQEKEYFNPSIQTDTFYQSWVNKVPDQTLYLSRIQAGTHQYRYFIESSKNGITKSFKIDDYIMESGNLLRLLLAFRYKANNPISVTITHYSDHFELKRYVKNLPYPEEVTLQAIGWPINSISDNLNFCYHSYMLPEIKNIFKNLLIKINEVTYE